jgi:hypothetical protein
MPISSDDFDRGADHSQFQIAIEKQLTGIARGIGDPFRATVSKASDGISLDVWRAGDDDPVVSARVRFDAPHDGRDEWQSWLSLTLETANEITPLLTLAWIDSEPDVARGLNSAADVREGAYASGNVVNALRSDLRTALQAVAVPSSRSLVLRSSSEPVRVFVEPSAVEPRDQGEVSHRIGRRASKAPLDAGDVEAQRGNVSELLIARLMKAMQTDLADAESDFVGAGIAVSAQQRFGQVMEWAMVGTAYGVEAKTNQIAMASFLGGEGASWLYGLVGPVLIGGLASMSKSKLGKGAAFGLMATWALAMASITASEKGYLDRAQGFFPKGAEVLLHENAIAAAALKKEAADAELKRLSAPAKETSELLVDARKRWQAAEIKAAAERDAERRERNREKARQSVVEAGIALSAEELRLREAIMNDPSRAWAWRTLFAIFGVINFAGPMAISRVLEKWRDDHAEAEATAKEGHKKKSEATLLRGSRAAQKAHAMSLLPALLDDLRQDGVAPDILAALELGDISQKAAERFDRAVNGKRVARGLFGLWRSAEGPS